ncbi:hypothetical protein T265_12849, partial [Opisthorchis viverrini]
STAHHILAYTTVQPVHEYLRTTWVYQTLPILVHLSLPEAGTHSLTAIPNSLAEPRQIIYRTQTPVRTRNYSPQCVPSFSNAGTVGRSVTCLRSTSAAVSRPGSAQLVYATLRRPNIKPVTYVPVTLNNQGAAVSHRFTTHTLPFLTPPAAKRCIQSSEEDQMDRSESPSKRCFAKNEYTSLVSNAMCSNSHCHEKSSPSVPGHPCASLRTFIPNQSQYHDSRNNIGSAIPESTSSEFCPKEMSQYHDSRNNIGSAIPESTSSEFCPKEMVYPCCCPSCEPLLATWTNYEGMSIGHSGSDSTRTCPQCHALDVPVSHGSLCCNANCAKTPLPMPDASFILPFIWAGSLISSAIFHQSTYALFTGVGTCPQCHALDVPVSHGSLCCNANCAKTPLPMPDGRTDDQPHTETDFDRQLNGQCSTTYMSVQDILNSCV